MENPHQKQQKDLIHRITTSVKRLNDVLASINSEIGELESCHANIDFVSKIWTGAAQNLALNSTIPSTQQKE
ncbi:hypothetical protein AAMO2058_000802400 [Amorphochlora amoebiformis]